MINKKALQLETERLLIGHGEIEDYVKIHEYDFNGLQNIKGIMEYIRRDPEEVRGWYEGNIDLWYKKIEDNNNYAFIGYLKDTMEPIIDIGFDRIIEEINAIEVSIWMHPKYWGNGYARESLLATMKYIFDMGFDNIKYEYVTTNNHSKKLCERIGFERYEETDFGTNYGTVKVWNMIMSKNKFIKLYCNENIYKIV